MGATPKAVTYLSQNKMNFVKKDLAPGITVYRPEFKDLNNTLDVVKKSIDSYTALFNIDPALSGYPENAGWKIKPRTISNEQIVTEVYAKNLKYSKEKGMSDNEEVIITDEINEMYDKCFKDYLKNNEHTKMQMPYIKEYNYDQNSPDWFAEDFAIHRQKGKNPEFALNLWEDEKKGQVLEGQIVAGSGKSLGWHFDEFQFVNKTSFRSALTGNIYLNDEYESGRIMFLYGNDWDNFKKFDNLKIISYKPMAGDIIFYPAYWPVAHAVTIPFNKDRYMVTKIWKYKYNLDDFDSEFMDYCKELYDTITDGYLGSSVPKERIKTINGKDFWVND